MLSEFSLGRKVLAAWRWRTSPFHKNLLAWLIIMVVVGALMMSTAVREPPAPPELKAPPKLGTLTWTLFTKGNVFDVGHRLMKRKLPELHGVDDDVAAVLAEAVAALNARDEDRRWDYQPTDLVEGMYLYEPGAGVRYRLSFNSLARARTLEVVDVVRPLAAPLVRVARRDGATPIHLVLPYFYRPKALSRFLADFERLAMDRRELLRLAVVFFSAGDTPVARVTVEAHREDVEGALEKINQRTGQRVARLLTAPGNFSRGRALLRGADAWRDDADADDPLLFFVDVDMVFGQEMLRRCRANAAPGRRAYFPIVFTTFNPRLVAAVRGGAPADLVKRHPIAHDVGFWIDYGYGMSCVHRSDFAARANESLAIDGWGGEDDLLFRIFDGSGMEVVRAPDPDLVHVYHAKTCADGLSKAQRKACLGSKFQNEASRETWARWVHALRRRTNPIAAMDAVLGRDDQ